MEKIRLIEKERRDIRVTNLKETRDIRRRLVAAQYGLKEPDLRSSTRSSVKRSSQFGSRSSTFKEEEQYNPMGLTKADYDSIDIELEQSSRNKEGEEQYYEEEENQSGRNEEEEEKEEGEGGEEEEQQFYEEEHDGSSSPPAEQPEDYE